MQNDLKSMGVKGTRKKPHDRTLWAIMLKEALLQLTIQVEDAIDKWYCHQCTAVG
jgi:hypothetical protein